MLGSAVAGDDGTVSLPAVIPADRGFGGATVTAVGAGSGYQETAGITVLATTVTSLTLDPAAPKIDQAVTLTATVTGSGTDGGTMTFEDGAKVLGTAPVTGGTASLTVKSGFQAGTHSFTAAFGGTATTDSSVSDPVQLVLTKGQSAIAMALSAKSTTYGHPVSGIFSVAGATGGTVTVDYGTGSLPAKTGADGAGSFKLPAGLSVGTHSVSVRYDGTDAVASSRTATQKLTVSKARTSTSITVSKKQVKAGSSVKVTVTVGGHSSADYPTGTMTVKVKLGGTTTTHKVTLTAGDKGKAKPVDHLAQEEGRGVHHRRLSGERELPQQQFVPHR